MSAPAQKCGATRNLTQQFNTIRSAHKSVRSRVVDGISKIFDDERKVDGLPPAFMPLVDGVNADLQLIQSQMSELAKLYSRRLKVSFGGSEKEQDQQIEAKSIQITKIFRVAENKLKRIAIVQHEPDLEAQQRRGAYESLPQQECPPMSAQEKAVRLNVMRAVGSKVQDATKQFRSMQREFLRRLKGQEKTGNDFFATDQDDSLTLDELDMGLTQAQISQLREQESHAQKRSKEIDNIVKSINDLADLFKELSVLVVEQGSMLDRIDYNIETTVAAVKQGHKELQTAEEYQKSRGTMMCAFMLIVLIFVLFAILVFKWMA